MKFLNFLAPGSGSRIRILNTDPDPEPWFWDSDPSKKDVKERKKRSQKTDNYFKYKKCTVVGKKKWVNVTLFTFKVNIYFVFEICFSFLCTAWIRIRMDPHSF
jgi:hypothetical protein